MSEPPFHPSAATITFPWDEMIDIGAVLKVARHSVDAIFKDNADRASAAWDRALERARWHLDPAPSKES